MCMFFLLILINIVKGKEQIKLLIILDVSLVFARIVELKGFVYIYRVYKKKLNRFEIALNFAKQPLVSSFFYVYSFFGYL
jgi:hypothetical protein